MSIFEVREKHRDGKVLGLQLVYVFADGKFGYTVWKLCPFWEQWRNGRLSNSVWKRIWYISPCYVLVCAFPTCRHLFFCG